MSDQQRLYEREIFAVLDSPASGVVVRAPADRYEARRLKADHTFHCSSIIGGCGQELTFAIGEVNIPHFRHRPESTCPMPAYSSAADRYTHLAIQMALQDWIRGMPGFDCRLEVFIDEGRTDVLAAGRAFEVSLEVQRSALSAAAMKTRTQTYLHRAGAVNWLYESTNIDAFKAEIAEQGWALRLWWGWAKKECRLGVRYLDGTDAEPVVRDLGGPLTDWTLTAHGLDSPHLDVAKVAVAERDTALAATLAAEALRNQEREARLAAGLARTRLREQRRKEASLASMREYLMLAPEGVPLAWPAEWPALQGSPKQVEWAENLRYGLIEHLKSDIGSPWLKDELAYSVAQWFATQKMAKFWIDSCASKGLYEVMEDYEQLSGQRWLPR